MKIALWSVGKAHDRQLSAAIEDFTTRIQKYYPAEWQIISPPKNAASLDKATLIKQEGQLILAQLQPADYLVLLDEKGKMLSSPALAALIAQRSVQSTKRIVFLIGGAFGVDQAVRTTAHLVWSLSDLVFPHMLVRLILAEQIYRACSINRGEKYHHV
ncbi:23S rRNA (pseudouridine(1915)-N(3))-methyltransferase RlmH [Arachidicoccus ginsenosidivorans]|jgi:23S rRNA (pseudouridine1915-N3)-methyltransferase|uniref:Ribosomal RNA large subunit methyltransferase H n=1 Tax=Arachidicoccus ginsenosidivorans TaxID=496057 RepID=A0A5B8VP35_9BACT|nr:23S rRNA (pseudouridine(1915)-N(3))-methyltransferase RlmH [Arachidicoccus ginsenosidivorans]QEC72871.1 23S rRNA (pseudouridine(1915)-N(3))-methyltransferase RlmH [Arachidicoccus ginsenosidivorans]